MIFLFVMRITFSSVWMRPDPFVMRVNERLLVTKINPTNTEISLILVFSITVLRVGSVAGVNGPVISLSKGRYLYPRLRGNNLVTKYGLLEGYCVIPNKAEYMDDNTWAKVVKVVAPWY